MLRCVYVDLDRTLRCLLNTPDGAFTLLGARAFEACQRAGAEVVLHSAAAAAAVEPVAHLLACQAYIADAGELLELDGDAQATAGLSDAVARHMRARACRREHAIAIGPRLGLQHVVGTFWLEGDALEDPLLRLELEGVSGVRTAEDRGPGAFYEAVMTSLAERSASGP